MNVKSGFLSGLESETGTKAGLMAAESRGGGGALDNSACSGDGLHVSTSESSLSGQTDYITKKKKNSPGITTAGQVFLMDFFCPCFRRLQTPLIAWSFIIHQLNHLFAA